jgi:hypothetical protein
MINFRAGAEPFFIIFFIIKLIFHKINVIKTKCLALCLAEALDLLLKLLP